MENQIAIVISYAKRKNQSSFLCKKHNEICTRPADGSGNPAYMGPPSPPDMIIRYAIRWGIYPA